MQKKTIGRVLLRGAVLAAVVVIVQRREALQAEDAAPATPRPAQAEVRPEVSPAVHGKPIAKWKATAPPEADSKAWYAANHSETSWKVSLQNGEVYAEPAKRDGYEKPTLPFSLTNKALIPGELFVAEVADGWLTGRNAGEWGGDLWWAAPDGKEHYKVSDAQIHGFLQTNDGLFAFEGLAHMSLNRGHILMLSQDEKGHWKTDVLADLHGAPEALTAAFW